MRPSLGSQPSRSFSSRWMLRVTTTCPGSPPREWGMYSICRGLSASRNWSHSRRTPAESPASTARMSSTEMASTGSPNRSASLGSWRVVIKSRAAVAVSTQVATIR